LLKVRTGACSQGPPGSGVRSFSLKVSDNLPTPENSRFPGRIPQKLASEKYSKLDAGIDLSAD
jgi:hypothetical protein